MRRTILRSTLAICLLSLVLSTSAAAEEATDGETKTSQVAVMKTNHGTMVFSFYPDEAPKTVEHMKTLITEGFYNGREFYRVVAGHVIQTGNEKGDRRRKVVGEFSDTLKHIPGAVGLARSANPNGGTTEFYICLADRPHLDGNYAIFGQVIEGMDVLEKIGAVPVDEKWVGGGDVAFHRPKEPVVIESLTLEER